MRVLFVGGTGLISLAVSKMIDENIELFVLNRGNNNDKLPKHIKVLIGDMNNEESIKRLLDEYSFDVVVNWIAYTVDHVKRDYRLFKGKTSQYIFISSASAYLKPLQTPLITEDYPLGNKYWEYSDNKRLCEEYLNSINSDEFHVTIIRPSHTYDDDKIIAIIKSSSSPYTIIDRMLKGKKIIIPDDGTSLWTLTYNKDFAEAFIDVLGNKLTYGEAYHITSDIVYTWERLNEIICENLGVKPNIIHIPSSFIVSEAPFLRGDLLGDKSCNTVFDNSKIKSISHNFNASTRYEDIAPNAINSLLGNKKLQNIDEEFNLWYDRVISKYLLIGK